MGDNSNSIVDFSCFFLFNKTNGSFTLNKLIADFVISLL